MENLRKHRDIKLVKTEKEGIISYQSKTQNYDTPKFYFKNLLPIEIKKKKNRYLQINQSIWVY